MFVITLFLSLYKIFKFSHKKINYKLRNFLLKKNNFLITNFEIIIIFFGENIYNLHKIAKKQGYSVILQ